MSWGRSRPVAAAVVVFGALALSAGARGAAGAPCTLTASGHSPRDEWGSCISVTASLSRAPAVGETAQLSFTVRSQHPYGSATISIELSANLRFVDIDAAGIREHVGVREGGDGRKKHGQIHR